MGRSERSEDVQATESRHHHVQQDQVEGSALDRRQGLIAVLDDLDRVIVQLQALGEHVAVHLIIVDDKQGG